MTALLLDANAAERRCAAVEARVLRTRLRLPPRLTVSEWADRFRVLSPESSAEPGPWRTDRAPYLREIMDTASNPRVTDVVAKLASQVGKTEILNNIIGYTIDLDPAPLMMIQPNVKPMAEAWSKDRLATMLRDSPRLRGRVKDAKSRNSGNTVLHKTFAGGHITIGGANSPAGLASRPVKIVLFDEVDRYPFSAGTEGDPVKLGRKRTQTFPNRKCYLVSSPTVKGFSRIDAEYERSDQRQYYVPCPFCGHEQVFQFRREDKTFGLVWEKGKPETAQYQCRACEELIPESKKPQMLRAGRWIAKYPEREIVGFQLSALYSPWMKWVQVATEWEEAQGNRELLQVFINTVLAELWEEQGDQVTVHELGGRLERYPCSCERHEPTNCTTALVPAGVGVLTCGVDVQADRLEAGVWGFGAGEESWYIAHELFPGDPSTLAPWRALASFLVQDFPHELGAQLRIRSTMVDSGFATDSVYSFTSERARLGVFASKGASVFMAPLLSKPSHNNKARTIHYVIGVATVKQKIMARLRTQKPGPEYVHLPDWMDEDLLEQLTAERLITRMINRRPTRDWALPAGRRNEQLDIAVYALAALHRLAPIPWRVLGGWVANVAKAGEEARGKKMDPDDEPEGASVKPKPPKRPRGGGFVNRWR